MSSSPCRASLPQSPYSRRPDAMELRSLSICCRRLTAIIIVALGTPKMLALKATGYSALMIGSSNFTCAGMGIGAHRNAEANILTIVDHVAFGREAGLLEQVWPPMDRVDNPEAAEWLGARPDNEKEDAQSPTLPAGFLSATYRAGDARKVILTLSPSHLPEEWQVFACAQVKTEIYSSEFWLKCGKLKVIDIDWTPLNCLKTSRAMGRAGGLSITQRRESGAFAGTVTAGEYVCRRDACHSCCE